MSLRPPACCRAVQRRVSTSAEGLWITDDILSNAYQRFCANNKAARRYGSNVPGPMESRRRWGRRRMAYMAEAVPSARIPPTMDFSPLWNALGLKKDPQWRWEPPTIPSLPDPEPKIDLPAWLTDYKPYPRGEEERKEKVLEHTKELLIEDAASQESEQVVDIPIELVAFRKKLLANARTTATTGELPLICNPFYQKFEQQLLLGLVSNEELDLCLHSVTNYLRETCGTSTLSSRWSFKFYQAVWKGMTSCKVMSPRDFEGKVLKRFLILISQVEATSEFGPLVSEMLSLISARQLLEVHDGVQAVYTKVAFSWLRSEAPKKNVSFRDQEQEEALVLANALNFLPRERALDVLRQVTVDFSQDVSSNGLGKRKLLNFRYTWLNLVSQVKGVDESLFIDIWNAIDESCQKKVQGVMRRLRISECCDVILNHWISRDLFKDPTLVRNTFDTLIIDKLPIQKLSCLIAAVDQHKEHCWTKTISLFHLLRRVGLYEAIYKTLELLPELGVKFPADLIARQIGFMTHRDFNTALLIYKIYPKIRIDRTCLPTTLGDSDFFIQMIRIQMKPQDIWRLLGIPLYWPIWAFRRTPARYRAPFKRLQPARISLITRMAMEFAHAEHLTPRQARRNVDQCLLYLKKHRASIVGRPDLSRALVHSGVTRELMRGKWVGTSTLRWVFRWVELAEGEEVKERLVKVVMKWRMEFVEKREWVKRDGNPLRVGPID